MTPGYELRDSGTAWEAVRHDTNGEHVVCTWDRGAVPDGPTQPNILTQVGCAVLARWGREPVWEKTDTGWVAR